MASTKKSPTSVAIEQSLLQSFAFEEVFMFCQAMSCTATKSLGYRLKPLVSAGLLVEHELSVVFERGVHVSVDLVELGEQRVDVDDEQSSGESSCYLNNLMISWQVCGVSKRQKQCDEGMSVLASSATFFCSTASRSSFASRL